MWTIGLSLVEIIQCVCEALYKHVRTNFANAEQNFSPTQAAIFHFFEVGSICNQVAWEESIFTKGSMSSLKDKKVILLDQRLLRPNEALEILLIETIKASSSSLLTFDI